MGVKPGVFASFIAALKSPFVLNVLSHALKRFKIRKLVVDGNRITWPCRSGESFASDQIFGR